VNYRKTVRILGTDTATHLVCVAVSNIFTIYGDEYNTYFFNLQKFIS